jgi:hypothetical protein
MAYSTGGTIQALDYNLLTWGGNATGTYTSTPSNLAWVWGVGNGAVGYGQDATAMTVVSVGSTVTATQWSTFVQRLNLTLGHQSGAGAQLASGSNIGITAGATIAAFANVDAAVTTVNTNAALFTAQGSTTTGTTDTTNPTAATGPRRFGLLNIPCQSPSPAFAPIQFLDIAKREANKQICIAAQISQICSRRRQSGSPSCPAQVFHSATQYC